MILLNFYCLVRQVCCCIPWNIRKKYLKWQILNMMYFFGFIIEIYVNIWIDFATLPRIILNLIISFKVVICASGSIIERKLWRKWNELHEMINKIIEVKMQRSLEPDWRIFIFFLLYITVQTSEFVYFTVKVKFDFVRMCILFVKFYSTFLLIIFSNVIIQGFKILNEFITFSFTKDGACSNEEYIGFCHKVYKSLFEMSLYFNDFFGWLMVIVLFECLITEGNIHEWCNCRLLRRLARHNRYSFVFCLLYYFVGKYKMAFKIW